MAGLIDQEEASLAGGMVAASGGIRRVSGGGGRLQMVSSGRIAGGSATEGTYAAQGLGRLLPASPCYVFELVHEESIEPGG